MSSQSSAAVDKIDLETRSSDSLSGQDNLQLPLGASHHLKGVLVGSVDRLVARSIASLLGLMVMHLLDILIDHLLG